MLNALGIAAKLVLVSTRRGPVLSALSPSLYHFDHMVVCLEWGGKSYWIDPTIKKQSGDLEHRALLDLAYGLAVTETGEDLTPIPWDVSREVYSLRHCYDFSSDQESDYSIEIEREYRFHRADNVRYHFHATPKQKLEQDFLGYALSETDLELEVSEPIHIIEDDARLNRLRTRERYRILSGPGEEERQINIFTDFVNELVVDSQARHPIRIDVEGCIRHDVEVRYRRGYDVSEQERIDTAWFSYTDKVWREGPRVFFRSTLQPLRRQVDEAEIEDFAKAVESMRSRSANRFLYGKHEFDGLPEQDGKTTKLTSFFEWALFLILVAIVLSFIRHLF